MKYLFLIFLLSSFSITRVAAQGDSLDAAFANPTDLTDQEVKNSQEFVHQGVKDRAYQEGCAKLNNCQEPDDGLPLETIIGKAYALIFGGMIDGGKPTLNKRTPKAEAPKADVGTSTPPADGKAKKETMNDYCMYAAMAYETLGGLIQQNLQSKADQSAAKTNDIQLQALINLKETHKARKTTATWQAGIYGAIASCYGVMAFTGAALDWKYWSKLGGATALTGLYLKKANKHAKASKKVQAVIDSLPKAGDCNPWTGTACFCKESTSKDLYPAEYQEICILNNGNFETPKVAVGCGTMVNNKVQYDKDCKCKASNTCLKSSLSNFKPSIGLGTNFMNSANTGFDLLSNGEFDEGKLSEYATGAAAMAGNMKPTKNPIPKVSLTPEQQKEAEQLKPALGNLAGLAAASASTRPSGSINDSGSASSAAISKLTPELKEKLAEGIKGNYKKGNSGFNSGSNEPEFTFPGLPTQAPAASESTEVLTFAEQAVMNADVTKTPETPIFDIISNRYRRSGWERLQERKK